MTRHDWALHTHAGLSARLTRDSVGLLPLGAIEQHGPHLPLATDQIIAEGLANHAVEQCKSEHSIWLLPAVPVGQGLEHAAYAGTLSLSAATFEAVVYELGASAARAGLRRLVLFSGHGGNNAAMDNAALRLRHDHHMLVVKACYFDFPMPATPTLPAREWREGLHGGALETALMLYFNPEAVELQAAEHWPSMTSHALSDYTYLGAEQSAARFAWLAGDLNPAGVVGDARLASAAMGEAFAGHYAAILADIIAEAARFPLACLDTPKA